MTGSSREAEPVIVARLFVPSSKVLSLKNKKKLFFLYSLRLFVPLHAIIFKV